MPKKTTNDLISAQSSGLMSRLAYTYGKHADANVAKLLKQSGLTLDDIQDVDSPN
jgi:hypothetical protein